jgi:exopolysaccharide production protein ExoZ
MNPRTEKRELLSIQYLRAVAGLMVVLHHARNHKPWLFNPLEGYGAFAWGVDIFFVISGFIMYVADRNENPFDFLRKRAIRVIPLYWCATIALFLINTGFDVFSSETAQWLHVLKSLAFIPHYNLSNPDIIFPYLIPGWALNYIMLFYFIFFVALISGRIIYLTSAAMAGLILTGFLFEFNGPVMISYTNPIILEFLIGVWIASMYLRGYLHKRTKWLLPVGFICLLLLPVVIGQFPLIYGYAKIVFSSMVIAGAVSLVRTPKSQFGKLLGDASYSIYITHTVISLTVAGKLWYRVPVEGWIQFVGWVVVSLCISTAVGVFVYLYFEKPMFKWLRNRWMPTKRLRTNT